MSEFTPITTQEEFDAAIKDRLRRDRESQAKKYEGWISPDDLTARIAEYEKQVKTLQDAAAEYEKTLADKDAEIAKGQSYRTELDKTKIALAAGLDQKYASRLQGTTPEEWKADAEMLAKDFASAHVTAPLGNAEGTKTGRPDTRTQFADWFKESFAD